MPRQARLDVPGALHHIIVPGIDRSAIFKDDQDKVLFLDRLSDNIREDRCENLGDVVTYIAKSS
jgi:putative transposase